jgi:hypothetical protein
MSLAFAGARRTTKIASPVGIAWSLGLALLVLCALPAGAKDAAVTMDGVARAAALMRTIAEICPPFGANAAEADKFYRAFVDAGTEAYGSQFNAALARETALRRKETKGRGSALWCEEQRERQKQIGNGRLFEPQR